tara:strand:- start:831 stop:1229 length:399 start_codon:yes stop_codon:yes gene_type:complete
MMNLTANKIDECLAVIKTVLEIPTPIVRFKALAAEAYFDVARRQTEVEKQEKYLTLSVEMNEAVILEEPECAPAYEMLALCRKMRLVAKHQAKFMEQQKTGGGGGQQFSAEEYLVELKIVVRLYFIFVIAYN